MVDETADTSYLYPEGDEIARIAGALVEAAPADWSRLEYSMAWAHESADSEFWVISAEETRTSLPTPSEVDLDVMDLREHEAAKGQPAWSSAHIKVEANGAFKFSVDYDSIN